MTVEYSGDKEVEALLKRWWKSAVKAAQTAVAHAPSSASFYVALESHHSLHIFSRFDSEESESQFSTSLSLSLQLSVEATSMERQGPFSPLVFQTFTLILSTAPGL